MAAFTQALGALRLKLNAGATFPDGELETELDIIERDNGIAMAEELYSMTEAEGREGVRTMQEIINISTAVVIASGESRDSDEAGVAEPDGLNAGASEHARGGASAKQRPEMPLRKSGERVLGHGQSSYVSPTARSSSGDEPQPRIHGLRRAQSAPARLRVTSGSQRAGPDRASELARNIRTARHWLSENWGPLCDTSDELRHYGATRCWDSVGKLHDAMVTALAELSHVTVEGGSCTAVQYRATGMGEGKTWEGQLKSTLSRWARLKWPPHDVDDYMDAMTPEELNALRWCLGAQALVEVPTQQHPSKLLTGGVDARGSTTVSAPTRTP